MLECPFCHQELIFTGKRTDTDCFGDLGASFYKCGCVMHFDWGDALPSNKWSHHLNGTWWYLREWQDQLPRPANHFLSHWENMTMKGLIPTEVREVVQFT